MEKHSRGDLLPAEQISQIPIDNDFELLLSCKQAEPIFGCIRIEISAKLRAAKFQLEMNNEIFDTPSDPDALRIIQDSTTELIELREIMRRSDRQEIKDFCEALNIVSRSHSPEKEQQLCTAAQTKVSEYLPNLDQKSFVRDHINELNTVYSDLFYCPRGQEKPRLRRAVSGFVYMNEMDISEDEFARESTLLIEMIVEELQSMPAE